MSLMASSTTNTAWAPCLEKYSGRDYFQYTCMDIIDLYWIISSEFENHLNKYDFPR